MTEQETGKNATGDPTESEKVAGGGTAPGSGGEADPPLGSRDILNASYVILFIAAVFIINAMETGSYRTPWPVAAVTAAAGIGLLAYGWHRKKQESPDTGRN